MRIALPSRDLEVYLLDEGQPGSEPVVLLHGMLHTGESAFRGEIAALRSHYRVIVPDARGHGRTPNPSDRWSIHDLADDTAALIEALGIGRAHFVGFSLGAMQLLVLARNRPELIASLTLIGGAPQFEEATRRRIAEVHANPSPSLLARLAEQHDRFQGAGTGRRLLDQWLTLATSDELCLSPADLGEITAPTLLLFGDRDPFYTAELPLRMRAALPRAELCIVPNCGHTVNLAQPALVQLVLYDFLRRHPLNGGLPARQSPTA
jgi:pimeloyl-ACP methyl ester carboxylesterase